MKKYTLVEFDGVNRGQNVRASFSNQDASPFNLIVTRADVYGHETKEPDKLVARNMENFWQFSKVYTQKELTNQKEAEDPMKNVEN